MTSEATKIILLANNIRKYRTLKDYSQNEFSELIGCSREHLAKVETAKRNPSLDLIFRIAEKLDISEKQLFDFENEPHS